jgi:hypothetical protein
VVVQVVLVAEEEHLVRQERPWIPRRHRELLRVPEFDDFDVRTA